MTLTAAGALAALLAYGTRLSAVSWWLVAGAALFVASPGIAAAVAVAVAAALGARRVRTRRRRSGHGDVVLLADLVVLGLRAGLTLENAFRAAADDVPPRMGDEVRLLLRGVRRSGIRVGLAAAGGRAERLYRIAAQAAESGAALAPSIEALAGELRHDEHTRALAAARRLPVRLLLPLALLILPGFVLVVIGPALIGSLARLEIGW